MFTSATERRISPPVDMYQWISIGPGESAETTILWTCIGVAAIDGSSGVKHLAHFAVPDSPEERPLLRSLASSITYACTDRKRLRVRLQGCGDVDMPFADERRAFVVNELIQAGVPRSAIETDWSQPGEGTILGVSDNDSFYSEIIGNTDVDNSCGEPSQSAF